MPAKVSAAPACGSENNNIFRDVTNRVSYNNNNSISNKENIPPYVEMDEDEGIPSMGVHVMQQHASEQPQHVSPPFHVFGTSHGFNQFANGGSNTNSNNNHNSSDITTVPYFRTAAPLLPVSGASADSARSAAGNEDADGSRTAATAALGMTPGHRTPGRKADATPNASVKGQSSPRQQRARANGCLFGNFCMSSAVMGESPVPSNRKQRRPHHQQQQQQQHTPSKTDGSNYFPVYATASTPHATDISMRSEEGPLFQVDRSFSAAFETPCKDAHDTSNGTCCDVQFNVEDILRSCETPQQSRTRQYHHALNNSNHTNHSALLGQAQHVAPQYTASSVEAAPQQRVTTGDDVSMFLSNTDHSDNVLCCPPHALDMSCGEDGDDMFIPHAVFAESDSEEDEEGLLMTANYHSQHSPNGRGISPDPAPVPSSSSAAAAAAGLHVNYHNNNIAHTNNTKSSEATYSVFSSSLSPHSTTNYHHSSNSVSPSMSHPTTRRGHYMPYVKAAAGSLIAVGGRRVPVTQLHLLHRSSESGLAPSVRRLPTDSLHTVSQSRSSASLESAPSRRRMPGEPTARTAALVHRSEGQQGSLASNNMMDPSSAAAAGLSHVTTASDGDNLLVVLQFAASGNTMRFVCNPSAAMRATLAEDGAALPTNIQHVEARVGQTYLARVFSSRSPYDNLSFDDVGTCVHVSFIPLQQQQRHASRTVIYDGLVMRRADIKANILDATQLACSTMRETQTAAECERQFRFLNFPFVLQAVHFTFDGKVCVVSYTISARADTSTHPNVSRLLKVLQYQLRCKVHLNRV